MTGGDRSVARVLKSVFPREHGAYIMLLTSVATGLGRARAATPDTAFAMFVVGFAYLSHAPILRWLKGRDRATTRSAPFVFGAAGMAAAALCSVPLFRSLRYFYVFVLLGGAVYGAALILSRGKRTRGALNEYIVFFGLCLASPLVYYAGMGALDATAAALWIFNVAYFGSTVPTVKIRLHGERYFAPAALYIVGMFGALAGFAALRVFQWEMLCAFTPLLAKLAYYAVRYEWFRTARLQTIGVVETLAAAAFAALVIVL